jgi:ABC-type amino acid transport substrate-binding protein
MKKLSFGPVYDLDDATFIVRPNSQVRNYAELDQPGIKIAAVDNTTTMRGAMAYLKHARVTGYRTFDEIEKLLKSGEIDAFALARDQLNAMAAKDPRDAGAGRNLQAHHARGRGAAESSAGAGVRHQIRHRGHVQRRAAQSL